MLAIFQGNIVLNKETFISQEIQVYDASQIKSSQ